MKPRKKKNCFGCRAMFQSGCDFTCELGYRIHVRWGAYFIPEPVDICPKPLTIKKLVDIQRQKHYETMINCKIIKT